MRFTSSLLVFLLILCSFSSPGHALLGEGEAKAESWGKAQGFKILGTHKGTAGCRKDKRYVEMQGNGAKVFGIFYQPVYQKETDTVTQVEFEFDPPVSHAAARDFGIKVAPIVGTRPPTHKQQIKPDAANPCIGSTGGYDERYTEDYILEYYLSPGGQGVQLLRIYNDRIL